jgi:hypothetical protein
MVITGMQIQSHMRKGQKVGSIVSKHKSNPTSKFDPQTANT